MINNNTYPILGGGYCSVCLKSESRCTCMEDSIRKALKNTKIRKGVPMDKNQKFTPKYWIGHDPNTDDVYIDTAAKDYRSCEDKFKDIWAGDEDDFYLSLTEGNIAIKLFKVDFVNDGPGNKQELKPVDTLQPNDFQKIVPKPYLRLEATEDFRMNDKGEVAFKKGRAYLFAYTGRDSYVTVSEGENTPHFMYREDLVKYFKLLE